MAKAREVVATLYPHTKNLGRSQVEGYFIIANFESDQVVAFLNQFSREQAEIVRRVVPPTLDIYAQEINFGSLPVISLVNPRNTYNDIPGENIIGILRYRHLYGLNPCEHHHVQALVETINAEIGRRR